VNIICTMLMSTSKCESCFSTLKRIETFLRSTMTEDRLNALAVLSIKKTFIRSIPDFDNKVIQTFSAAKDRRIDIMYGKKYSKRWQLSVFNFLGALQYNRFTGNVVIVYYIPRRKVFHSCRENNSLPRGLPSR
jgi:hypothetical protein